MTFAVAGRHHPEEQGLKLEADEVHYNMFDAGRHHPEEQGLKLIGPMSEAYDLMAGRHHPEEQGLKLLVRCHRNKSIGKPVGIIQKNKD